MIMPNQYGIKKLNLHPDTRIHNNSHPAYNRYVGEKLDWIYNNCITIDEKKYQIWLLLKYLKDNILYNKKIPWK